MRTILLCVLAATIATAQYGTFAVTDDGRLFFARDGKIYRVSSAGLEIHREGGPPGPYSGPSLGRPATSGDGSITGYETTYVCPRYGCSVPRFFTLEGVDLNLATGSLAISRNGRFLFEYGPGSQNRLVELPSKRTREIPTRGDSLHSRHVANTGAVLIRNSFDQALYYVPLDGAPRLIPGTSNSTGGVISPDGNSIAYFRNVLLDAEKGGTIGELFLTGPEGTTHRKLAAVPSSTIVSWAEESNSDSGPSFANDGALLYMQPGGDGALQPMLLAPGAEPRPLISVAGGVRGAILSGDGQVAWVTTHYNQLLRVRTSDGVADEFIPETPALFNNPRSAMPGSLVTFTGWGMSPRTQVKLEDRVLPIAGLDATQITVQFPWDVKPGSNAFLTFVSEGKASPFLPPVPLAVQEVPTVDFEPMPGNRERPVFVHQDWRGIVTADDPARPGEILHVYARNLGPVDQPVETGKPSPLNPPARITTPFACYMAPDRRGSLPMQFRGVDVLFAGLGGGLIGLYQIDVRVPGDWNSPRGNLQCTMTNEPGEVGQLYIRLPAGQ